jgi:hypothetical protein
VSFLGIAITFPGLVFEGFSITSPEDPLYNCIAFAAGDVNRWWWPDPFKQAYLPANIQRAETLASFIDAYSALGYHECPDGSFEGNFEKIAIYVSNQKTPTHAARQLSDGFWTSKLGRAEDIRHNTATSISGQHYGDIAVYMKRPWPIPAPGKVA